MGKTIKTFVMLMACFYLLQLPAWADTNPLRVGIYYGNTSKTSYRIDGSSLSVVSDGQRIWDSQASQMIVRGASTIYYSAVSSSSYEAALGSGSLVYYRNGSYYPASLSKESGYEKSGQMDILFEASHGRALALQNSQTLYIESSDRIVSMEGTRYRGSANIFHNGKNLIAVNVVDIEDYLKGVVPKEMPSSWNMEALKAQAVVARNYAISNSGKHLSEGFNVCSTIHCQVYGGLSAETASTNSAVEQTRGEMMYHGGRLVEGYFHSSSGGRTESSENIWNTRIEYLRGVEDIYSTGSPYDAWTVTMSSYDIRLRLLQNGINIGDIRSLAITKSSENGRALELTIYGSQGSYTLLKERIRTVLGSNQFKSIYFTLSAGGASATSTTIPAPDRSSLNSIFVSLGMVLDKENPSLLTQSNSVSGSSFVFQGKGYGHGVGMSQYGAKGMADKGFRYDQILMHYFSGVEIR